jgi:hypothetical protein
MCGRRNLLAITVCMVIALGIIPVSLIAQAKEISIHIRRNCKTGVSYILNDSKASTKNLTSELNSVFEKYGKTIRINIIGHGGSTIEDIIDIRGLTAKVGFESVRLYWVADSTGKMMEVGLDGPAFPATSTPP